MNTILVNQLNFEIRQINNKSLVNLSHTFFHYFISILFTDICKKRNMVKTEYVQINFELK